MVRRDTCLESARRGAGEVEEEVEGTTAAASSAARRATCPGTVLREVVAAAPALTAARRGTSPENVPT